MTVYSTKGTATYSQSDKKITLSLADSTSFFTVGEQVTVTAVYNQGTSILQVAKPLTVSNTATLTEFELGEITTTRAALKDAKINLTNLGTGTYYFPVKSAKDQYGNALTAKELDTMMVKEGETGVEGGNLYITPYTAEGAYAYVDGFAELDDGSIAMEVKKGGLNSPGTAIFTITGVSGFQGTQELTIVDDPYIAELTVSAPTLYVGEEAELTITAKDQDGNDLSMFDLIGNKYNKKTTAVSGSGTFNADATYYFDDFNHLTKGCSSIKFSDDSATFKVTTNTSKKTVTFTYTPGTKGQTIVSLQTATPTPSNITWTVEGATYPAGISKLATGVETAGVVGGNTIATLSNDNIVFLSNSGAEITASEINTADATLYPQLTTATTITHLGSTTSDEYYYKVSLKSGDSVTVTPATGAVTSSTSKTGSSKVNVTLYSVDKDDKVTTLASKDFTFTVAAITYNSYKAKLATGSELLYVNKNSGDYAEFVVIGVDADGNEVEMATNQYSVTVDSGLSVDGDKVLGACSTLSAKGTAVATIWAQVNGTGADQAVATVDVPYDVAAPVAQSAGQKKNDKKTTTVDYSNVTAGTLTNGVLTLTTDTGDVYKLYILDQYNQEMADTVWAIAGTILSADYEMDGTAGTEYAITATNVKVSGSWTATNATNTTKIEVKNTASTKITNETDLRTALAKAASDPTTSTTITLEGNVVLSQGASLTVAAGDTLVVAEGYTLTDAASNLVEANGEIQVDGTLRTGQNVAIAATTGKISVSDTGTWAISGSAVTNDGTIENAGTITNGATLTNNGVVTTTGALSGAGTYDGISGTWNLNSTTAANTLATFKAVGAASGFTTDCNINITPASATTVTLDGNLIIGDADTDIVVGANAVLATSTRNFTVPGSIEIVGEITTGGGTVTVKDFTVSGTGKVTANAAGFVLTSGGTVRYAATNTLSNAKFALGGTDGDTAVFTDGTSTMSLTGDDADATANYTATALSGHVSQTGYLTGTTTTLSYIEIGVSGDATPVTLVAYTKGTT